MQENLEKDGSSLKVLKNFLQFGWLQKESNHKFQIQIKIIFKPKCIVKFIKALNWEEKK